MADNLEHIALRLRDFIEAVNAATGPAGREISDLVTPKRPRKWKPLMVATCEWYVSQLDPAERANLGSLIKKMMSKSGE